MTEMKKIIRYLGQLLDTFASVVVGLMYKSHLQPN